MEDWGYVTRLVWTGPFWHRVPVSGDKNVLLFLVQRGDLSHRKCYNLLLGRRKEVGEPFLHVLFLKCLLLKII